MTIAGYLTELRTFPGDAVRAWRVAGWAGVRDEVRKRTIERVGGYARRFVIESDLARLAEVAPPEAVEVRPFTGPDWSLLANIAPPRLAHRFEKASAAGRTCLVAWKERHVVGYAWLSPRIDLRHEEYDLPLPPDAIYIWQLEVSPDERRQGVAAALLSSGLQLARARGVRRSWIVVHPDNVASLRTIASVASSQVLGTVRRLKVLTWMYSRYRALSAPVQIEGTLSR
jgi:ribosomal protein S18 acetylase RimI-like enzyme